MTAAARPPQHACVLAMVDPRDQLMLLLSEHKVLHPFDYDARLPLIAAIREYDRVKSILEEL